MVISMINVEKTCPVCGCKFVVDKSLAERELYCTLGCCSKAMGDEPKSVVLEV
ncbi:hypothetical protein HNV12_13070 [Methanococcoides sp. SA1]|nr:hypothetical protein [Methanococcoides sp. SA1]